MAKGRCAASFVNYSLAAGRAVREGVEEKQKWACMVIARAYNGHFGTNHRQILRSRDPLVRDSGDALTCKPFSSHVENGGQNIAFLIVYNV